MLIDKGLFLTANHYSDTACVYFCSKFHATFRTWPMTRRL